MSSAQRLESRAKDYALAAFCLATALLIPFGEQPGLFLTGWAAFALSGFFVWRTADPSIQRKMAVLLGCVALLAWSPIETSTADIKFVTLGLPFLAVIVLPWLILRRTDPGTIVYQWWPRHANWLERKRGPSGRNGWVVNWGVARALGLEIGYVLLSIPLAWAAFRLYFGVLSPEVPFNWSLPETPQSDPLLRLFVGINAVGIWDELFFVNTCFAVLRTIFPFWTANLAQSVVYTAVLYDMAFTGWGPLFVFGLALTQGIMFERAKTLIYVIVVHLIVDYFLFQEIVDAYYPDFSVWWHP
ncbi:MAG: hypothetical protein SFU83_13870 [Meiothermus sp.]|nr:hypothetical protein [Meiothermus sp.]